MKRAKLYGFVLGWVLSVAPFSLFASPTSNEPQTNWFRNFFYDVGRDYLTYYGKENLPRIGGMLLIGGISANTNLDRSFKNFWQDNIKSKETDRFFKPQQEIGFFNYKKIYIGSIIIGYLANDSAAGNIIYQWGYRAFRGLLLGSPQVTLLRMLLGGGRPPSGHSSSTLHSGSNLYSGSKWRLFKYGRPSCSGHTFNGALPFLSAAMMVEKPIYRYSLYVLSALPGIARINDNKHYFSQVFLGWSIAFLSAKAVDDSDKEPRYPVNLGISEVRDGTMLHASLQF